VADGEVRLKSFTVVAAVIRDREGRILLTRRPEGTHMAGLWEFPGGKVLDGESPAAALQRELCEELGVEARTGTPITFAVHEEEGLRIVLLFFEARIISGEPRPREGQQLAWVAGSDLGRFPTPPADAALVERLAALDRSASRP
jgi:8-oxo-dGTP diphosphatase